MNSTDGRFSGIYKCGNRTLEFGKKTLIMGILNLTPDSFSDGGRFNNVDAAVDRCAVMIKEGADCIDIGAESTGPKAVPISAEEELERLIPSLTAIRSRFDIPLSVDTYKSETAAQAITAGADIINDVNGFLVDPGMAKVVADSGAGAILMFNRRTRGDDFPAFEPISRRCVRELTESIEIAKKAGMEDNMIMTDPGIGFGKTQEDNLVVLHRLAELMELYGEEYPLLLGASRKSFIGHVLDLPVEERMEATGAVCVLGIQAGCQILRVHDVKPISRMARMADAIMGA